MKILHDHILAFLDVRANNAATPSEISVGIGIPVADVEAALAVMASEKTVTFDQVTMLATLTKPENTFTPYDDPLIPAEIKQALSDLFADGAESVTTFLAGLSGMGLDARRAYLAVYVTRQLALGIAAKRGDDRLRQALIDGAIILDAVQQRLGTP
jgi:hypothetical protein